MYIHFFKISDEAKADYTELCPRSSQKIAEKISDDKPNKEIKFDIELCRKIRRCANLGNIIQNKNGFEVRHYFDLLFVVKDYKVLYIYKQEELPSYIVSEKTKATYDWLEEKLTNRRINNN